MPKFSFFAALRPSQCLTADDPGSHNICVCAQHENIKLKLDAWDKKLKYRDLLDVAVCGASDIKCMLHQCKKCPGVLKMKEIAESVSSFSEVSIKYKYWNEDGSKASLETVVEPFEH